MATPTLTSGPTPASASATETCITAIPDQYGYVPYDACNSYYNFYPSFSGNLAFTVLFGVSTIAHIVEAVAFKKKFCWVVIMGGIWETAAFAIRTVGAHNQQELQYAIWGTLLFILAPLWVNAFAYMTVARMIHFSLPEKKFWGIKAAKLTLLFIWLDIVCFVVQVAGGSMLSNDGDAELIRVGKSVYTAGIALQMVFVVIFLTMAVFFYRRLHQVRDGQVGRIKYLIWSMLAVLSLIMMRIIYRLIEFSPGISSTNPLLANEAYPFTLDAMPMLLALTILNIMHPGLVLRGPDGEFPRLSRAEKKAVKARKREEKRMRKAEKKQFGRLEGDTERVMAAM